jgi:hypothetical protein
MTPVFVNVCVVVPVIDMPVPLANLVLTVEPLNCKPVPTAVDSGALFVIVILVPLLDNDIDVPATRDLNAQLPLTYIPSPIEPRLLHTVDSGAEFVTVITVPLLDIVIELPAFNDLKLQLPLAYIPVPEPRLVHVVDSGELFVISIFPVDALTDIPEPELADNTPVFETNTLLVV